jgi:hypothetical protein
MFDALSRGDPSAWAIVALSLVLIGAILVIRQQTWFIKGGTQIRQTTILVLALIAIAAVIGIVLGPRFITTSHVPETVVNNW